MTFTTRKDYDAHNILTNSAIKRNVTTKNCVGTDQIYFKTTDEMKNLFKIKGAIENTIEINKINLQLDFHGHQFRNPNSFYF